jgi:hypothetical protein
VAVSALTATAGWAAPATDPLPAPLAAGTATSPRLRVMVDPRVELLSLIFRLAGNPEYTQCKVESYTADVQKRFGAFQDHPVVKLARKLRSSRGVSYDACMSMAVHLTDADALQPIVPFKPWPEGLDRRWTAEDANNFLVAARQFVKDSSFQDFLAQHRALYETTESRMRALMEKEAHLEWFYQYFGEHPQAGFTVAPGLLNGGSCYGAHCRDEAGREELFCILGVWKTDTQGLPTFDKGMLGTVVHEFGHSYANAIIDRHARELTGAGEKLYRPVAGQMRSQAYGDAPTMLRESLVRACEVRYHRHYDGEQAAQRAIRYEKGRGFLWTEELSNLLGEYEGQRERYPTLESFAPRLVAFFKDYTEGFASQQAELAAKRPKVVSMTPPNGAREVDPGLKEIRVVFDRPMKDQSWALVGGGPHCPETTGKSHYDAKRTAWTVPVKLKPDWSYEFRLNFGEYDAFRSADNVPLESVLVTFTTGKEAK